jgi:ATP-dependent RNA helicase RhlE
LKSLLFADIGLADPLLRALDEAGLTHPTPIQAQAIPHLLDDYDLLGIAQTGTGKTAAFALPILQHLSEDAQRARPKTVRALILAPTRELAIQIDETIARLSRHLKLSHAVIFGGVGHGNQIKALARGVDVLVATPGRLLDLLGARHVRLEDVSHLVLDEADRMLDMGFVRDVMKIVAKLPQERQSLLFSATMPTDVAKLAEQILYKPVRVEVTPEVVTVDAIEQYIVHVATAQKRHALTKLLAEPDFSRVVVFTRTKHGANRVSDYLRDAGISTEALHGNKSQGARQRALQGFKSGDVSVLVATDIAARGIDVADVSHVVNFDLPNIPESYVHRIGRTGRAGRSGTAYSS